MKGLLFFISLFISVFTFAQSPKRIIKKLGNDPVFFIDSISIDKSELNKYNPKDIATVSVYKDSEAISLVGPDGKDGVVYIVTKAFAKKRYWNYFRSKSTDYAKMVLSPESDSTVQYILNERVLKSNYEGDLELIDDNIFKELIIIDKETLKSKYNIQDKEFGVMIKSDKPADLYHAKKKF